MVEYRRNLESLKRAVAEHTVDGYPVKVPIFGDAEGISTSVARDLIGIRVRPIVPMPLTEYIQNKNLSTKKLDRAGWVEYARQHNIPRGEHLAWLPSRLQTLVEEGYSVSQADIEREYLKDRGCLDLAENVTCDVFDLRKVQIPVDGIAPGMLVEFDDAEARQAGWPGRVVGIDLDPDDKSKIVFVETFEPVPFLSMPEATAPWMIQPEFISDQTWVIGYGTYEAMRRRKFKIPNGSFGEKAPAEEFNPQDDKYRLYYLEEPMPLKKIAKFCEKAYPGEKHCIWQSAQVYVVPIHPAVDQKSRHHGGVFRPFPDDIRREDIQASIDHFGGAVEFEE